MSKWISIRVEVNKKFPDEGHATYLFEISDSTSPISFSRVIESLIKLKELDNDFVFTEDMKLIISSHGENDFAFFTFTEDTLSGRK